MKKLPPLLKILFILGCFLLIDAVVYEPYTLKTTKYYITNSQLKGIKILFAADFHIAPYKWEEWRLQKIIEAINNQNVDLVILGGDYVNRHSKTSTMPPENIASYLQQIKSSKIAVLGNHDTYYGKKEVKKALEDVKIPVLNNQNIKLNINGTDVCVAGVSDYNTDNPDVEKALKNTCNPLIFVTHSPDIFVSLKRKVDISFAGHTHGGQIIIPFFGALAVNTDSGRKYTYGLFHKNGKPMVVSSGLGTSVIPVRFNNIPEIVVVEFE
ncbi:MAG: metallophosphoesterase [Alphaproteobacteria bacterium]|nr:metallophosphoesterase [Alphaproteobacteria bacterium]